MQAVLLCRVSSKEQEEAGYSLPSQEKLLSEYAVNKGFSINSVFPISESANGKKQREIFNKLFEYVNKNDIKIVIVEKADRFTRNLKDSVDLYYWLNQDDRRQLHSVKDSLVLHKNSRSQEKLNWDIRIVFAKNYVDNLSEEVKKGQKEKLAQGWLPTKPPIGYKTVGEKGRKIHVIDEEVAPLVLKMFELYATGEYSLLKLTKIMTDLGLRNGNGNKIVKSRIHQYLNDVFYIGVNLWKGKEHPGKQETFISEELFSKVQSVLHSKSTPKYRRHFYLYNSLIKCRECGGTITWEAHKGTVYGHCNHYKACSQSKWSKENEVTEQLINALSALKINNPRLMNWVKKALKECHQDNTQLYKSSVKELTKQLQKINNRLDHLYDDKLDGRISERFYNRKFEEYSKEIKKTEQLLSRNNNKSLDKHQANIELYELSQNGAATFSKSRAKDAKRSLIKHVFSSLTLDEGVLDYNYTKPCQIILKAVKKTNSSKELQSITNRTETFEQQKKTDCSVLNTSYLNARPILLPR